MSDHSNRKLRIYLPNPMETNATELQSLSQRGSLLLINKHYMAPHPKEVLRTQIPLNEN